jgi:DNA-binding SARP family transcriptional activator/tetratricopeptide (TPR) repeat protein
MPEIWFRVLGPLEVRIPAAVVRVPEGRSRQLLVALLLHADQVVPVGTLINLLWPEDQTPPTARKAVQVYVSKLRQLFAGIPEVVIHGSRHGYRLTIPAGTLDLRRFRDIAARSAAAALPADPHAAARLLGEAVGLWRGSAVAELTGTARGQRLSAALGEERVLVTEAWLDALLRAGAHRQVASEAAQLLAEHPLRERLRGQLMIALYHCGRPAEALSVFDAGRHLLREELGLDPGRALRDLQVAILNDALEPAETRPAADAAPAPSTRPVVPAQLPIDLAGFVGRSSYLDRLDKLFTRWVDSPATPMVVSLTGTAGVGKTTLAVHWAHRIRHHFPDGQLYVNLRGFDPAAAPMGPGEAIQLFLAALPAPERPGPFDLPAQVGLYRSLLADRRVLIVLDNARDAEQVRPLLPGSPGSLVVVTSRDRLTSLVAAESAQPVHVDLFSTAECRELLAARVAPDRLGGEPDALAQIVTHCARLPLALAIVSARAATNPDFRLAAIATELGEPPGKLAGFDDGDHRIDLRATFSWSYRTLSPRAQRLFRLFGLHLGGTATLATMASLAGLPPEAARPLLTELARAHLIAEPAPGRYEMHDLLRAYADELVNGEEPESERRAAAHRLLGHYLHTARRANDLLFPSRTSIRPPDIPPGVACEPLTEKRQALAWFTEQRAVLLCAVEYAAKNGFDAHAWQLVWATTSFQRGGYWSDTFATHRTALEAAVRCGDRAGEAHMRHALAIAHAGMLRYDEARRQLILALDLFTELDDTLHQAEMHHGLGWVCEQQGDLESALPHGQRALELFRRGKNRPRESVALNNIGWIHARLGNYPEALRFCQDSLALWSDDHDDPGQRAHIHDSFGYLYRRLGDHAKAIDHYRQAVELCREAGSRYNETLTLTRLGDSFAAAGDRPAAERAWQQALDILTELHHPDAAQVRARLDQPACRGGRQDLPQPV